MPVDEGMFEEHSLTPYSSIELDPSTNDSMKNLPVNFYLLSPQAATPKPFPIDPFEATGADFQPTISSASKSANPSPSLTLATHDSSKESVSGIIEPSVADSAHRVINFITHMIREDRRIVTHHSDKGIDFYSETSQLSQPQRTLLQKVLSVALGQISDDTFPTPNPPEPTEEKQGGFQCNVCSKRTRLRCEMKSVFLSIYPLDKRLISHL